MAAEQARRTPDGPAGRRGEGRGGGLGRSEINCLAGVQEVGNRLQQLLQQLQQQRVCRQGVQQPDCGRV